MGKVQFFCRFRLNEEQRRRGDLSIYILYLYVLFFTILTVCIGVVDDLN